uniref:Aminopeptidase n=1 Tax=Anopheles melas TaxID=34690 RepID=A0A182TGE8_9DIPT
MKTLSSVGELFRVYAPENKVNYTVYAHDFAVRAVRALENHFGRQNQMRKIDLVGIPDFAMGAMENWGMITFREDYLIYQDEEETIALAKQKIASVITHELVHMWFDPAVLNGLYDYVVYQKSASVIRMIQNVIGFDTFQQAINDYLRSRSYLTTRPQYLYTSIEKFRTVDLPASVEVIFESWANTPGYPVVMVSFDRTTRTLTASQKRFWMPNEVDTPPQNMLFYIPVNYGSNVLTSADFEETTPTFWLTPQDPTATVTLEAGVEWVVVNKQQTGYYRVNYDDESWHKLIEVLNSEQFEDQLPVINRAQLVDDVANLARAGEVGYDVALSLMQYLERETDYIPWATAYNALLHLDRMFSSHKEYNRFENYVGSLASHVFNEMNLFDTESHLNRLHRDKSVYLACEYGVEIFQKYWLATDQYQPLMDKFINALGCSRNLAMNEFYLQMIEINETALPITVSMKNNILNSMIKGGPATRSAALSYAATRALAQAEENLHWIAKHSGIIAKWLVEQNFEGDDDDDSGAEAIASEAGDQNHFYLNSDGLVIATESIKVTGPDGTDVPVANVIYMEEFEQIYFGFRDRLQTGEQYKIAISFLNNIGTELKGLYRSSYMAGNTTSVTVGDYTETTFDTTPLMSTYLLAFVISDFKTLSHESDRFRVFAAESKVAHTTYALEFLGNSLRTLENFFGRQYQLPKVDLIAIPDFAMGAMENWGLITFREQYLIYEEGVTTARTKQNIADLITHELTHMWFGNEVTPEWWTYLWLSEGFARYFEYYITSQLEPTWNLWQQFIVNNVHSALSQDCNSNNRMMSYYATDPAVLNDLFDYVVYAKSASVIRMIQNVIGFDTFRQSLNDYLRSRSYLTTRPQYLYTSIEKFRTVDLPASVEVIFESWANTPGYPVVTVSIDRTTRTLTASQKRFWMPNEDDTPPQNMLFYIPVNYGSNVLTSADFEDTTPTFWLTPQDPTATVTLEAGVEWVVVNKQQTGYYRVNYDDESWDKLIEVLNSEQFEDQLPVINRAQLVDDVANLARAGEVGYDVALSLMQYLERETDYIPWATAYNALQHLDRMFSSHEEYTGQRSQIYLGLINGSPGARQAALQYLYEHFSTVTYLLTSVTPIFTELGNRINTRLQHEVLKNIVDEYGHMLTTAAKTAADAALMKAEQNIRWVEKHAESITSWLVEQDYEGTTAQPPDGGAGAYSVGHLIFVDSL